MQAYRSIPIAECGDPLIAIPAQPFIFTEPHPYVAFGAPYGDASPWMLRQGVLEALMNAQARLTVLRPGWKLKLFDAYRPVPVQAFMVWREFQQQAARLGKSLGACRNPDELAAHDPDLHARLAATVFTFWGVPSDDPETPPPHSTGAAVDLTLQDAEGRDVDMGCPIDETSERAYPEHFAETSEPQLQTIHANRELLNEAMTSAGFSRHANEWWHFSFGDQMAAFTEGRPFALYGRARR